MIGAKVRTEDGSYGIVVNTSNDAARVAFPETEGFWFRASSLNVLETAAYTPNLKVGSIVRVKTDNYDENREGIIYAIIGTERLPYYVGFSDGYNECYSSKELELVCR